MNTLDMSYGDGCMSEYDSNGKLLGIICADEETLDLNRRMKENDFLDGVYRDDTHYVLNGEPVLKQELPITLDGMVLKGVPANSTISIEDEVYEVGETTDVTLTFNLPGIYKVLVSCWPYLDKEFTIDYQPQP